MAIITKEQLEQASVDAGYLRRFRIGGSSETIPTEEGLKPTIAGIVQQALQSASIDTLEGQSFTTGATISLANQALLDVSSGEYYRWTGDLSSPKNVPANSTPSATGGIGPGKWLSAGQGALRSDLYKTSGAELIGLPKGGKLSDSIYWVTPEQYGDVSADADISAIVQIAINENKYVVIPEGSYKWSSMVTVPIGHYIKGCGKASTVINVDDNVTAFKLDEGQHVGVSDMSILYKSTNTSGCGVDLSGNTLSARVCDIYMRSPGDGIKIGNAQSSVIENIEIWYPVSTGLNLVGNLNDVYMNKIFINGANITTNEPGAGVGIKTAGKAHALFMSFIEVIQCSSPLLINGSSATNIETAAFSFIIQSYFDSSTSAATIKNARAFRFIGCWFSNRDTGISIADTIDCSFISCQFVNNDSYGAIVQTGCSLITFMDCTFDSNGQGNAGNLYGIICNATSYFVVSYCKFGNFGTFSPTQGGGIRLIPGIYNSVSVCNNTFHPSLSGTKFNNQGTVTNLLISDNIGFKTKSKAISSMPANATTLPVAHGLDITPALSDIVLFMASGKAGSSDLYVTNINAVNFTINVTPAPTAGIAIGWRIDASIS